MNGASAIGGGAQSSPSSQMGLQTDNFSGSTSLEEGLGENLAAVGAVGAFKYGAVASSAATGLEVGGEIGSAFGPVGAAVGAVAGAVAGALSAVVGGAIAGYVGGVTIGHIMGDLGIGPSS